MSKTLITLLAVALLPIVNTTAAKKPVDLSEYAGTYKGAITFLASGSTSPGTGIINVSVRVPESGSLVAIAINGSVTDGSSSTLPVNATLLFTDVGFVASDVLLGISPVGGAFLPGGVLKSKLTAAGTSTISGTTILIQSTAQVKTKGKKKTLTLSYTLSAGSTVYAFQITAKGKAKTK